MLCGSTNVKPVCASYYSLVIITTRCMCRPHLKFDDTNIAFTLTNRCNSIGPSLINSPPIFGTEAVGKSARTLTKTFVALAMMSYTIVGIGGRFFPWGNLSNMLKN